MDNSHFHHYIRCRKIIYCYFFIFFFFFLLLLSVLPLSSFCSYFCFAFLYLGIKRSKKGLTVLKNSSGESYGISPGLGANGQKLPRLAWLISGFCILTFRQSQKNIFGFFQDVDLYFTSCCCELFFALWRMKNNVICVESNEIANIACSLITLRTS